MTIGWDPKYIKPGAIVLAMKGKAWAIAEFVRWANGFKAVVRFWRPVKQRPGEKDANVADRGRWLKPVKLPRAKVLGANFRGGDFLRDRALERSRREAIRAQDHERRLIERALDPEV